MNQLADQTVKQVVNDVTTGRFETAEASYAHHRDSLFAFLDGTVTKKVTAMLEHSAKFKAFTALNYTRGPLDELLVEQLADFYTGSPSDITIGHVQQASNDAGFEGAAYCRVFMGRVLFHPDMKIKPEIACDKA